jgi:hypothetical protein
MNLYGFVGNDGVAHVDILGAMSAYNFDSCQGEEEQYQSCSVDQGRKCPGCKCLEFFLINAKIKGAGSGYEDILSASKALFIAPSVDGTMRILPEHKLPVFEPIYFDDHGTKKIRGNAKAIHWVLGSRWKENDECKICRNSGKGGRIRASVDIVNNMVGGTILPKGTANWTGTTVAAGAGRSRVIELPSFHLKSWTKGWRWPLDSDFREAKYDFTVDFIPENGGQTQTCFDSIITFDMKGWATDLRAGVTDGEQ